MHEAGLAAYAKRSDSKSAVYAYEQRRKAQLDSKSEKQFRANKKAWDFFQSQPPWYRRTATYWVISAKREYTRERRLALKTPLITGRSSIWTAAASGRSNSSILTNFVRLLRHKRNSVRGRFGRAAQT